MKRWLCIWLAAALLLCAAALPVFGADAPALRLEASVQDVCPGQTVTLTLSLPSPINDVGSLEVHLLYDSAALTLQKCTAGSANRALRAIEPTAGRAYTGVLFVYDYGTDAQADCRLEAGTLLTAVFAVRDDAKRGTLPFRTECAAALDTSFRPLTLPAETSLDVALHRPSVAIERYVPQTTVPYRASLTLSAEPNDPLPGGEICWLVNENEYTTGRTCTIGPLRADARVQAQYRLHGEVLAVSETETVQVRAGFFARLAAFFRALFGVLPKLTQSV